MYGLDGGQKIKKPEERRGGVFFFLLLLLDTRAIGELGLVYMRAQMGDGHTQEQQIALTSMT